MIKTLKRWLKPFLRPLLPYLRRAKRENFPQTLIINDLAPMPLTFRAHTPMEKHRVTSYGDERDALERLLKAVRADDVVFDIGASVGVYALALLAVCPRGKVFAFEPDPETAQRLQESLALNPFTHGQVVTWAVSDSVGTMELFTEGAAGFAPTMAKQNERLKTAVVIPTKSLDSALANGELPVPTVLKIDIEGAEVLALRGAKRLFAGEFGARPRLLLIEFHPQWMGEFGATMDDLHAELSAQGYRVMWEDARSAQVHRMYTLG